jgi:hypothetical protein
MEGEPQEHKAKVTSQSKVLQAFAIVNIRRSMLMLTNLHEPLILLFIKSTAKMTIEMSA